MLQKGASLAIFQHPLDDIARLYTVVGLALIGSL